MSQHLSGTEGTYLELLPDGHPFRTAIQHALADGELSVPRSVVLPDGSERLVILDRIVNANQTRLGVVLVARNITYLSQVESTLSYSRKLAALGRTMGSSGSD